MSALVTVGTMFFSISYGLNIDRVLRIYLPWYRTAGLRRRWSVGLPVLIAGLMLIDCVSRCILYLTGDAAGSTLLALLAGVSVLLWLRDQYPEHDYD